MNNFLLMNVLNSTDNPVEKTLNFWGGKIPSDLDKFVQRLILA